mmetsp:Transcript_4066/g.14199  ORF Transcript_4066/g.14199 Transcript_4066/m.14199 type:complete len:119 (-) Transcript_4066:126-482(-)
MSALPTARGLFRSLLRARSHAFRGDATALAASGGEIRKHFEESRSLGPEEARKKIQEGVEAESFIRLHVVQARGNERGNYEMQVEPQHVDGEYEVPGDAPGGCGGAVVGKGGGAGEKS